MSDRTVGTLLGDLVGPKPILMQKKCPHCQSLDVRQSRNRVPHAPLHHIFLSRYRCRNCRERFWVISRNTYLLGAVVGASLVFSGIGLATVNLVRPNLQKVQIVQSPDPRVSEAIALAKANDADAQYRLAGMYLDGEGVPQDYGEGRQWLERAARQGHPDAQYRLGIVFREGKGVIQDFEKATKWLRIAAEGGSAHAQYQLGLMYYGGRGVPQDHVKAYTWFNLAAADGIEDALRPREAVVRLLTPEQILEAQAEARRLSEAQKHASRTSPVQQQQAPSQ